MTDFRQLDKSDFECWQLDQGGVYFGQVTYVDQDNKIVEDIEQAKKEVEEILNQEPPPEGEEVVVPKFKRVRHGLGVNCYGRTEEDNILCKYEGNWEKDKKHGQGFLVFPDGSTYRGNFKNDKIEGDGVFHWAHKDHTYEGSWKDGRLEGEGSFSHADGTQFNGTFFNNYKLADGFFVNPFLSSEEEAEYQSKCKAFQMKQMSPHQEEFE